MIIWVAPVLGFLRSALPYALLFLRPILDFLAPKPTAAPNPYNPPFTGGQCVTRYRVIFDSVTNRPNQDRLNILLEFNGAVLGYSYVSYIDGAYDAIKVVWDAPNQGIFGTVAYGLVQDFRPSSLTAYITNIRITRVDGLADDCGNLPDPVPPPSIPDDGLFIPTNPTIGDNNGNLNPAAIILLPAAPIVFVSGFAAALAAALAGAKAAADALAGIKLLAEGFELLKDLFKKIAEDLDEKEKLKPKNRDIVRQTYGQIKGDGALDFFPNNNTKFEPIQLDIIIVAIPIGFGKYFGSFSPHRYRYKELGYISFYSVNQGILETHSIQFKRTTLQIPPLAIGFIYHLGLDEQIRGFAFGTFSVEKT